MHASGWEVESVTPHEIRERLERGERFRLLDVREPLEHRIARVEGAELIPLGSLPSAIATLEPEDEVVVMCHTGIRSAMACDYLIRNGFTRVRNLAGGIDRWSVEVDPTVPRY
jgi:adenylyltransferase/sulfurtransferase